MTHQMIHKGNGRFHCSECGYVVSYDPVKKRLSTVTSGNPNVAHTGAMLLPRDTSEMAGMVNDALEDIEIW